MNGKITMRASVPVVYMRVNCFRCGCPLVTLPDRLAGWCQHCLAGQAAGGKKRAVNALGRVKGKKDDDIAARIEMIGQRNDAKNGHVNQPEVK